MTFHLKKDMLGLQRCPFYQKSSSNLLKQQKKIINFHRENVGYLIHYTSDNVFKGTVVVNRIE